jgi:hypothetical protein
LTLRQCRSMNTLPRQAPLPSRLMAMPLPASASLKVWPSELRALVGVEYLRLALARQALLQRLDAERRLHRNRQPPRQYAAKNLELLSDRKIVATVDHRFAPNNPALVSAFPKKRSGVVSSLILACSDFTLIAGCPAGRRQHRTRRQLRSQAAPSTR